MIKTWKNSATRQFAETGKSRFPGLDIEKAMVRLTTLNRARSLDAFADLSSIGLHKLSGDRKGQWAVKINGPWRLVFEFEDGHAYSVEIVDYH